MVTEERNMEQEIFPPHEVRRGICLTPVWCAGSNGVYQAGEVQLERSVYPMAYFVCLVLLANSLKLPHGEKKEQEHRYTLLQCVPLDSLPLTDSR